MEAAFFDLDKTVIAKASIAAFGPTLYNQGLISKRHLLRVAVAHLVFLHMGAKHGRLEKMRGGVLQIIRGWERDRMTRIVREALTQVIEPIVYREARDLIRQHQKQGRKVIIISSSPQEIVVPLKDFLGADDAISTRASIDAHGRYTGELDFYAYGPAKATAIKEMAARDNIDLTASYAYSDSATDTPMLETVGHPVAVNPDKDLAKTARANKWPIVIFNHPIPLRDRRATTRLRVGTVLFLGAGAAWCALAIAYWRLSRVKKAWWKL